MKKRELIVFSKLKQAIIELLFLFVLTYEHNVDIRHIYCVVYVYIETREKTTTVRGAQHINCLLVSCSLAFLTRPSLSLSLLPHPMYAGARHYSHNYSLLSILFFFKEREKGRRSCVLIRFISYILFCHMFYISFNFTQ